MSISINLPIETEALIMDAAKRSGTDVGQFVAHFITEKFQPGESNKTANSNLENQLFKIIHKGFTDEFWNRFRFLDELRHEEKLNEAELAELVKMNTKLNRNNVNRMKALTELAALRNVPLVDLMSKLGLLNVPSF